MANITRWDPFRELMDMRSMMDRMLERSYSNPEEGWQGTWDLPLDVMENQDEYVVKASIPGIKPEDLDITYNDKTLMSKGTVKGEDKEEDTRYHLRERWSGSFARSITLPVNVQADKIQATCDNGILTLHLPKTEEVKPKRIQIQGANSGKDQKMIDSQAKEQKK